MTLPSQAESSGREPGDRRQLWITLACWVILLLAALPTLARPLARVDWRIDLLTHFQVAHVLFSGASGAVLWRIRRRLAFLAFALALVQLVPLVPYYGPNPVPPSSRSPARLRLVVLNVLVDNADHQSVEDLLTRESPDLIGLLEYTPDWKSALRVIADRYPYRVDAPDGAQGLALWSRVPLQDPKVERHISGGWPCVHAELEFAGFPLDLWLVHPSPPVLRAGGFPELSALASRVGSKEGARLVIGDLNTTSGSPHFADFLDRTGLRDSRLGFGLQGSWPSGSPYRIAIDHALVSSELAVVSRRLGPYVGSDHRALILELAPSNADRQASTASQASSP